MKHKTRFFVIWFALIAALLIASLLVGGATNKEAVQESMRDAVLHESNVIDLFGLKNVNPGLISGFIVTLLLLAFAAVVRIFVVPRFRYVPGRLQMLLEQAVGLFDGLAKSNSPWRNRFLGAYIFAAGAYIFVGTLFELLGLQVVTVSGHSIALPAPLSDVNGAIMMGCLSYLVILSGGIAGNGAKGILLTLKEFSLPISMSFRLFAALLSTIVVTQLVYNHYQLIVGPPVVVGVLFTILHALIQCYVLTLLTSIYYGEVSNPEESGKKRRKKAAAGGSLPGAE
ncbi:MAG: F0F1 ATP synthase subunit A [Oscillospiraceae bacterium]|nr:F0F1 ATP synthase subunit A [Oscillospiraceae bacterium]